MLLLLFQRVPWSKSSFKARDDYMPGSPYFDGTPKGILTWPKLLKLTLPIAVVFGIIAWQNEILIEGILAITIGLMILAAIRR